jgi:cytochrome c biogenesis protein CcmG/thiol:disulfide interchange protein DsbE
MMKRWGAFIGFLVIAALLGGGIFMAQRDPGFARKIPSPLVDKPVPEFALPELLDPAQSVSPARFAGQVWLLNVWGSWCPECWREHGYLERLSREEGLVIVGLNWRDERADALDMLRQAGNPYTAIGVDPHSDAAVDLGVYGAPESFLIDKRGTIRFKHIGSITPELWREVLGPLVRELEAES